MTPAQRDLILAALGLTERNGRMPRWSYRNRYFAGPTTDAEWESMVAAGWATRHASEGFGSRAGRLTEHSYVYHVTRAGAEAAGALWRVRREDLR